MRLMSYTKTNKLITALYMVTDIMDKEEPLRNKLRTLGTNIISDMHFAPVNTLPKISEIMSFLDIASAVNIISEMNSNILRKEFTELNQSISESKQIKPTWLEEFLENSSPAKGRNEEGSDPLAPTRVGALPLSRGRENSKGHTRIGVQKGSTLMKALSDRTLALSVKKQRRDLIISVIKASPSGVTITDIKTKASGLPAGEAGSLISSCSEKTLQRELVSMVKDSILNKTGEKRWSRYQIRG
ncbi:MAG: Uncharacterized protein G01um101424_217 [Parcubacteria group bacterium Gr01-1014_24]|nr:MAG: Uncharacterized protein G01um101424_217 [Parcubacteria group bacterium Gr01-1014_24]